MALIYTKLTDKTTVLAPREGVCRKFDFGDDWTEVRMGVFASAVSASGSDVNCIAESSASGGITDFITFGIKDDSQTYPGQVGSTFLGLRSGGTANTSVVGSGFAGSNLNWLTTGYYGATMVQNATGILAFGYLGAGTAASASGYATFFGIKIVISNRGLSSQTVAVSASNVSVSGTNYSAENLRSYINNETYSASQSIAWNDGAAARAIPDCVWVRVPLYNNALRISAIRAIRYAP